MHRRTALTLLGFTAMPSFACTAPPAVAGYTKAQLVAKTKTIVLAENVGTKATAGATEFSFRAIHVLSGKNPGTFKITLTAAPPSYIETDFSSHTDTDFWEGTHGRLSWLPGSCTPAYAFEVGGQYLLFLESLGNGASAERIRTPTNRWYQYVSDSKVRSTPSVDGTSSGKPVAASHVKRVRPQRA
jgi:hypothetical protein